MLEAFELFEESLRSGHTQAAHNLALIYQEGGELSKAIATG